MTASTNQGSERWTIAQVLAWATRDFAERQFDAPRLDAELLLAHALETDRIHLIMDSGRTLDPTELAAFRALIVRRRKAEPIAYILGYREFYGHEFRVDDRVLVPRPDSEILVEVALRRTAHRYMYGTALDLCTGSGCVAVALAKERPTWHFTASDISTDALDVAKENALRLSANWSMRFVESDLFAQIPEQQKFDLITGNPPYIPPVEIAQLQSDVRDFEPRLALDGGGDGLEVVRKIVAQASSRLSAGGILALEIGAGQANQVIELFAHAGFTSLERQRDYGGHERVISGQRAP